MCAFRNDERGFTPIAGSGMLVGIVVVLLALVGAAVFGLIDGVAPPDAEFEVETEGTDLVVVAAGPNQFRPKSCTSAARTRTRRCSSARGPATASCSRAIG